MKIIFICSKSITFNTFLKSQANYFIKKGFDVEVACSDINNLNFKKYLSHKIFFPTKILDLFKDKEKVKEKIDRLSGCPCMTCFALSFDPFEFGLSEDDWNYGLYDDLIEGQLNKIYERI